MKKNEFEKLFGSLTDPKNNNPLAKLAREVKELQRKIERINKK